MESLCDLCGNFAHLAVKKSWFLQFSKQNQIQLSIFEKRFSFYE